MSTAYVNTNPEMPTQVLGLAADDFRRTEMLFKLAQHDPSFQNQWKAPTMQDALRDDIHFHFKDPALAARAIGAVGYIELTARERVAGPIETRVIRGEKRLRRIFEPAVRKAIQTGLIDK